MQSYLNEDSILLCTEYLDIVDKLRFASSCTSMWQVCSTLFSKWDKELAEFVSGTIREKFEDDEFVMTDKEEEEGGNPSPTKMTQSPDFVLRRGKSTIYAFDKVAYSTSKVTYVKEEIRSSSLSRLYGGRRVFEAVPKIQGFHPVSVKVLSSFPSSKVEWEIHPNFAEKGVAYKYGGPHFDSEDVVFVRSHNVVSADVWVHSRIKIEMMGTAHFPTRLYYSSERKENGERVCHLKGGHVNMTQLRVYCVPVQFSPCFTKGSRPSCKGY